MTFRQVDPLFVIDLSDPYEPKVLGELKMPGASNYLHPLEGSRLLGIGFENTSVKISLFDVSDPTKPGEIDTYRIEQCSYSPAQYDHHAVLFDQEMGRLVIPVCSWGLNDAWYQYFCSACIFNVTDDGIALWGEITHGSSDEVKSCPSIYRSLYIDDRLYTISDRVVKANSLIDLKELSTLVYAEGYSWYDDRVDTNISI